MKVYSDDVFKSIILKRYTEVESPMDISYMSEARISFISNLMSILKNIEEYDKDFYETIEILVKSKAITQWEGVFNYLFSYGKIKEVI